MLFLPYVLLFLSTTLTTTAIVQLPSNMSIPAVIVFGDSIGDQGNNNNLTTLIKCNFSPYGKDFTGKFATGRFTNSKTPPDLLGTYKNVCCITWLIHFVITNDILFLYIFSCRIGN